jgi:hypothetical protein
LFKIHFRFSCAGIWFPHTGQGNQKTSAAGEQEKIAGAKGNRRDTVVQVARLCASGGKEDISGIIDPNLLEASRYMQIETGLPQKIIPIRAEEGQGNRNYSKSSGSKRTE